MEKIMDYTEAELAAPARRENNKKRGYLVVNRLQGKHIPVSPGKALEMFERLADLLAKDYAGERLLLVGFAETATAVGAAAAGKLDTYYIQTTREAVQNAEFFYFTEQHSHATEQKLVKNDLDRVVAQIDRIVFMEDEITTGNTIQNIVHVLREAYPGKLQFSAASLLNGMDPECLDRYEAQKIGLHYLVKTDHSRYEEAVRGFENDGGYHACDLLAEGEELKEYRISGYRDARRLVRGGEYAAACGRMCDQVFVHMEPDISGNVLVIGTEEFMYPALRLAQYLEKKGCRVRSHSTTRSPIMVSREAAYPLHDRYELVSLYDDQRRTFLYDIGAYDQVLILTDAPGGEKGIRSLVNAVRSCGNRSVSLIRWCEV